MTLSVHIYAPPYVAIRMVARCNTCRCRRVCVALHYAWHEPHGYCTHCGEDPFSWARRFKRVTFERKRKIESAKKLLAECVPKARQREAFQRLIEQEIGA